jgi:hypothetical protein
VACSKPLLEAMDPSVGVALRTDRLVPTTPAMIGTLFASAQQQQEAARGRNVKGQGQRVCWVGRSKHTKRTRHLEEALLGVKPMGKVNSAVDSPACRGDRAGECILSGVLCRLSCCSPALCASILAEEPAAPWGLRSTAAAAALASAAIASASLRCLGLLFLAPSAAAASLAGL